MKTLGIVAFLKELIIVFIKKQRQKQRLAQVRLRERNCRSF